MSRKSTHQLFRKMVFETRDASNQGA